MGVRAPISAATVIVADPVAVERALADLFQAGIPMQEQPSVGVERLRIFVAPGKRSAQSMNAIADLDLTERQLDVLELIAEGLTNREIGARLYLAEGTVKTHLKRLFARLGATGRETAVAAGFRLGILGGGA
ncbi:hypothetical protein SD37_11520 [Amycolatopsis orientalis]|uniref:HTH luxR-type domain-containing protein n=1 Tax=Amycolatopsis orientalis TaxID=31958 RepID=A0A193BVF0_AMYOR|nr:helix-turn-helix transcriptional regulator [Amycolatopsis orientalis]ANN16206.1 hypothetical protein SD37_11520 [Amycolatopsis orientalis]